jgi:hypothetical protein
MVSSSAFEQTLLSAETAGHCTETARIVRRITYDSSLRGKSNLRLNGTAVEQGCLLFGKQDGRSTRAPRRCRATWDNPRTFRAVSGRFRAHSS